MSELLITREGTLMRVALNRPHKGNALSASLVAELLATVDAARAESVRLLLLTGEGRHFCTGFDLSALSEETDDSLLARFTRTELLLQAIHTAPFDTLAIAQGRVMGAGADLFCACAHRWVTGAASFAFPGAAFGIVLGTARLGDVVGAARAKDWVHSGSTIAGDAALAAGLVQRQLAAADVEQAVDELLAQTQRLDAPTHGAIRQALDAVRRPRGEAGDAQDLARLVQSAARAGLRERILAYRAASTGR